MANSIVQLLVFTLDDSTFEQLGEVNDYTAIIWPDVYNGYAAFQLWAPVTSENALYFKSDNILWRGGEDAVVIEMVEITVDEFGNRQYNIKGHTLEVLLTRRILWETFNVKDVQVSEAMYQLVTKECVSPTIVNRRIPFLVCAGGNYVGDLLSIQRTGDEVYNVLTELGDGAGLGFDVVFEPYNRRLVFRVTQGVDRTIDQHEREPIRFSTKLENLITGTYHTNNREMKTLALVAGEETESGRTTTYVGETDSSGFNRRELYVDARDLQSTIFDVDGVPSSLLPAEYLNTLVQRGVDKLSQYQKIETFEGQVRTTGVVPYEYGVDYFKGDIVTLEDVDAGILVAARIVQVSDEIGDTFQRYFTYGYRYTDLRRTK